MKRLSDDERAILDGRAPTSRKKPKRRSAASEQRLSARSNPYGPTPEQKRKTPEGYEAEIVHPGAGPVEPVRRHRQRTVLDRYKHHLTESQLNAVQRFIIDSELTTTFNLTQNYDGVYVDAPGARHGGVSDRHREAKNRLDELKFYLSKENIEFLKRVVLAERNYKLDRALTMQESVRHLTKLDNNASLSSFGAGYFRSAASQLEELYHHVDRGTRPNSKVMLQIWQERKQRYEQSS